MRIKTAAKNKGVSQNQLSEFSDFLLSIGEGKIKNLTDSKFTNEIQLSSKISKNMDELQLIKIIYPDINTNYLNREFLCNAYLINFNVYLKK